MSINTGGDRPVELPSLNVEHNYPHLLSELVMRLWKVQLVYKTKADMISSRYPAYFGLGCIQDYSKHKEGSPGIKILNMIKTVFIENWEPRSQNEDNHFIKSEYLKWKPGETQRSRMKWRKLSVYWVVLLFVHKAQVFYCESCKHYRYWFMSNQCDYFY